MLMLLPLLQAVGLHGASSGGLAGRIEDQLKAWNFPLTLPAPLIGFLSIAAAQTGACLDGCIEWSNTGGFHLVFAHAVSCGLGPSKLGVFRPASFFRYRSRTVDGASDRGIWS